MDIEKFLAIRPIPDWSMEPNLYIVLQDGGVKQPDGSFRQNRAHRCGAAGLHLYKDADLPFGSENTQSIGLRGRLFQYIGYFNTLGSKIIACLRVKKALVAEQQDRIGESASGSIYNISRGSNSLVRTREKEFHQELDSRGLRWQTDRNNELFVPKKDASELISSLRQIRGEQMHIFSKDSITEDPHYRGGSRKERIAIQETQPRQQPQRESRAPSLTITLSKAALEQLRSGSPQQFERLINLVRGFDEERKNTTTVRAPAKEVEEIRQQTDRGRELLDAVVNRRPTRRSPRLAEQDDRTTEATVEAPRRRSARLAGRN